jgi:outer membrane murein-binding lipoprotein Lpp
MIKHLNRTHLAIPVALLASLTLAACGGGVDQDTADRIQQRGTELQQQGEQLQRDAQKAADDVRSGKRSAEEVQKELEQRTKTIQDQAKDVTNDAIDAVKDDDRLPDEARKALEDAQQQVNSAP